MRKIYQSANLMIKMLSGNKIFFPQMPAVRTDVRAYMEATLQNYKKNCANFCTCEWLLFSGNPFEW